MAEMRTRFPGVPRIVAIGDLHGDLDATRRALRLAGAIDEDDHWQGGDLVLVQTGDQLDRGDDEQAILDLFTRLTEEAEEAGGRIHVLNGNHELMNAELDLRYVTEGGYRDFQDAVELGAPDSVLQTYEGEQRARVVAFRPGGVYAKVLAERNLVVKIGDNVFVHGGILPQHVVYGLERLNSEVRAWLRGDAARPDSILERESPVWTRRYSDEVDDEDCEILASVLKVLSAERMIVGHTPQEKRIQSFCEGKVWCVDVGMAAHYGGEVQVLEIQGDSLKILREEQLLIQKIPAISHNLYPTVMCLSRKPELPLTVELGILPRPFACQQCSIGGCLNSCSSLPRSSGTCSGPAPLCRPRFLPFGIRSVSTGGPLDLPSDFVFSRPIASSGPGCPESGPDGAVHSSLSSRRETVIAWRRRKFREHQRRLIRSGQPGRPAVAREVRDLIRRLSSANPLCGAPHIVVELAKIGINVTKSTVEKYMVRRRKPPSPTWQAFLRNHVREILAVDFFVVPTVRNQVLFVFLVLAHHRRRVLYFNVTTNPTARWTAQQVVKAFLWTDPPRQLLRDHDKIYGESFRSRSTGMDFEEGLIAARRPWQNPFVERLIGSIRRECFGHVIEFDETHLRRILRSYFRYCHEWRVHQSLEKDCPKPREVHSVDRGRVVEIPEIGGLHHHYERMAA